MESALVTAAYKVGAVWACLRNTRDYLDASQGEMQDVWKEFDQLLGVLTDAANQEVLRSNGANGTSTSGS